MRKMQKISDVIKRIMKIKKTAILKNCSLFSHYKIIEKFLWFTYSHGNIFECKRLALVEREIKQIFAHKQL